MDYSEFSQSGHLNTKTWLACHDCDLLIAKTKTQLGTKALCPRCGNTVYLPKVNSVERSLALAITGLLLFIPANLMPIMSLRIMGQVKGATIFQGVQFMSENGQYGAALLVLFSSIVAPLIKILLIIYVSACLHFKWSPANLASCFRWYKHLDAWGMLEVYTLGIIVSVVKLMAMAAIMINSGLYCFSGLLIITTMLSSMMDKDLFWEKIEQGQGK